MPGSPASAGIDADGTIRFRPGLNADGETTVIVDGLPMEPAASEDSTLRP